MRTVIQYAVPALIAGASWLALIGAVVAVARWARERKAKPGYAPLWALVYVLLIIAVLTVCSVFTVALRSPRHRAARSFR